MLKKNLENIEAKLKTEKQKNPELLDPRIIAVSKKQPIEKIRELNDLGVTHFGENYVQEALDKMEQLKDCNIHWHFIGSLQSKKLKDIVGRFEYIHSVSRLKEVDKISSLMQGQNNPQKIFVQINIGKEESKSGVLPDKASDFCQKIKQTPGVQVVGLMFFPPLGKDEKEDQSWFTESRKLYLEIKKNMGPDFNRLSMGTSQNYYIAYREGASDLRVGESLMGSRSS